MACGRPVIAGVRPLACVRCPRPLANTSQASRRVKERSPLPRLAVFVAYAMVTEGGANLYTDPRKITPEVEAHLKEGGVEVGWAKQLGQGGAVVARCLRPAVPAPMGQARLVNSSFVARIACGLTLDHAAAGSPLRLPGGGRPGPGHCWDADRHGLYQGARVGAPSSRTGCATTLGQWLRFCLSGCIMVW